ncbi:MAG TPA: FAD:protein FMN transferase [Candidatus Eisenbacteria bacterium]|nr:FAD:protein FMN transferase [Candidatus Eisenbacteria bacterium]
MTITADVVHADWTALGTQVRLVVTEPAALAPATQLLRRDLAALDLACSRFRADSELRALDHAEGRPVRVSPLLADAVEVALEAARRTGGDVDPTVGRALAAVGYDRDFRLVAPTGPALHVVPVPAPGWRTVHLDRAARLLTVPPGVRLDLGATAKALGADRAATRIADRLGCGVLVSLGGDVRVAGQAPDGGWQVRVQDVTGDPADTADGPHAVVSLWSGGLATSGTRARRWVRGGNVLHHIVDPRNGLPARSPWRTVSVVAGTCVAANTASTGAVIKGLRAPAWLERVGACARLVRVDGTVRTVGGWPAEVAS